MIDIIIPVWQWIMENRIALANLIYNIKEYVLK